MVSAETGMGGGGRGAQTYGTANAKPGSRKGLACPRGLVWLEQSEQEDTLRQEAGKGVGSLDPHEKDKGW